MTVYSDVPAANMLYDEQERINQGIALVDGGGLLSTFTILPPPADPMAPMTPNMMMSVMLQAVAPSPALMQAIRDAMVTRSVAITAELAALGVTETPPAALSVRMPGVAEATNGVTPAAAGEGAPSAEPPSAKRR
jgi:hypothetical protein